MGRRCRNLDTSSSSASWHLLRCSVIGVVCVFPFGLGTAHAGHLSVQASSALISTQAAAQSLNSLSDLQTLDRKVQDAAKKALSATVSVRVGRGLGGSAFGSGVIVSEDGYVLTAAHVTNHTNRRVRFRLADGRSAKGITLGLHQDLDMGLMKITDPGPWPYLSQGKSDDVKIGDWCIATGHPGGMGWRSDGLTI